MHSNIFTGFRALYRRTRRTLYDYRMYTSRWNRDYEKRL